MNPDPDALHFPESHRVFHSTHVVRFGDCDPAGIVFYPNFYKWFDEAMHMMLRDIGWDWHRTASEFGWIGFAMASAKARFLHPVKPGDRVRIESCVVAFSPRRGHIGHRVLLEDGRVAVEGQEDRFIGVRDPDSGRIRSIELPEGFRDALTRIPGARG